MDNMHRFKQYEKEHTNSYLLRFNELIKRGELIFGSAANLFLQYQKEPYLAKKLIEGLKDGTLLKIYEEEALRADSDEFWLKTEDLAPSTPSF